MSDPTAVRAEPAEDRMSGLGPLFWDAGLSVVVYYGARAFDYSPFWANVAALAAVLGRLLYIGVRKREFDGLAAAMALIFAVGLGLTALTGDNRLVVLKDSVISGVTGLAILGASLAGRPAFYQIARRFAGTTPEKKARIEHLWETQPAYRRTLSALSLGAGIACLIEALVRTVLVYLLPIDVMVGLSQVLQIVVIVLLVGWILWYSRRHSHEWRS
jgi:hypothetical protein